MELKDSPIYKFIKNYIDDIEIVKFKKGEYIERADSDSNCIYYILDGNVKEESVSRSGNRVLIDEISTGKFAGHISKLRGSSFHCDAIAKTPCTLARIKIDILYKLFENDEFARYFYLITSDRIYYMYKKLLLERLFSWEEIVSYHILHNSKNDVFVYKSMYDICEQLNISRRGLYNIINKFVYEGYLEKKENVFIIKDRDYLMSLAHDVYEYYQGN